MAYIKERGNNNYFVRVSCGILDNGRPFQKSRLFRPSRVNLPESKVRKELDAFVRALEEECRIAFETKRQPQTNFELKANPYGIIKANKGKTGIVSVLYGVYHTKENANADFIQMYFEQDARLNNYLRPLVNKGAKNTLLISDTDALEGEVCLAPTFNEQKTIGQFFDTLDNLIALHQRERKNRLFGGKNVKQYNFSRLVLQLLRAMDSRLQRRGSSQGDYG